MTLSDLLRTLDSCLILLPSSRLSLFSLSTASKTLKNVFFCYLEPVDCKLVSLETENINGNTFRILQKRMNQYQVFMETQKTLKNAFSFRFHFLLF